MGQPPTSTMWAVRGAASAWRNHAGASVIAESVGAAGLKGKWHADRPASHLVAVTGLRGADLLTLELDPIGRPIWQRTEALAQPSSVQRVALTRANSAFVCTGAIDTNVFLYDGRGDVRFSFETPELGAVSADVTRAIGRCIGTSNPGPGLVGGAIGILAFRVR